jgi:sarcosine oxidase subunit beta
MHAPHVVIIGAGIVGASCAFHLTRRGARVTVLERALQPATGSTGKSAAGIRHQFTHPENVKMSLYSTQEFRQFETLTGMDAGYRPVGYLFLVPPQLWPAWQAQAQMQLSLGAPVELLEPDELARRYPHIQTRGLAGASFGAADGVLDPHGITLGYFQAARHAGATTQFGVEVLALRPLGQRWLIRTNHGMFEADAVVNAAGAFSGEVGARAGLDIPVRPYRRNVYTTAPLAAYPHPSPLMIDMSTGVWLRSEGERFIIGLSNLQEPPGDNQAVDWAWLDHTLEQALPRFPFLERAGLDWRACWAGLYEITPDHQPILGEMPQAPGFFNACGFSGHGVQHAPATGLIVAEEVLDGQAHSFDITDFRIERFTQERVMLERNVV